MLQPVQLKFKPILWLPWASQRWNPLKSWLVVASVGIMSLSLSLALPLWGDVATVAPKITDCKHIKHLCPPRQVAASAKLLLGSCKTFSMLQLLGVSSFIIHNIIICAQSLHQHLFIGSN